LGIGSSAYPGPADAVTRARHASGAPAAAGPVIAVTCLAFEADIAAGPGVTVLYGHAPRLDAALQEAVGRGSRGIISFGIAGGLAPELAPGDWVVASGVVAAGRRFATDPAWSHGLLQTLPGAVHADIAGVEAPVAEPADKRRLCDATGTVAVDMESHVAAAVAETHGLPFVACRVIIDPAHRSLPPAALVPLRANGTPDVAAVLWSLVRQPSQLPDLLRVTADVRAARLALLRGRCKIGVGLGNPGLFRTSS